ncbi:hypothetical protein MHYP_G00056760 [Metynnis hypsauchen]
MAKLMFPLNPEARASQGELYGELPAPQQGSWSCKSPLGSRVLLSGVTLLCPQRETDGLDN